MKPAKFGVCSAALLALPTLAMAQWNDDFESYSTGLLIPQSTWESWDNDPGAANATVVTSPAIGSRSLANTNVDDTVHVWSGYTSGVWDFTIDQNIPSAMTGTAFVILLNDYNSGAANPKNWSTQIEMDPAGGVVRHFDTGAELPLITGQYVEVKITIDLGNDRQDIYYGGNLLVSTSWTEGASGGGFAEIEALDLWGNGASVHYYDNAGLNEAPPDGACCFNDGSCTVEPSSTACETGGGDFQGLGSTCAAVFCPELGPNGWIVDGPLSWSGDTCSENNSCSITSARDIQWVVTIPWAADWTFSVCGTVFDTQLALGAAPCGSELGFSDDAPGCGVASEFVATLSAGTYYLTLEGFSSGDCGPFVLNVTSGPCEIAQPGGSTVEGEACGDNTNGGCNDAAGGYPFDPISIGETVWGTVWRDGTVRDTDWREITIATPKTLRWGGEFENPLGGSFYLVTSSDGTCTGTLSVPAAANDNVEQCGEGPKEIEVVLAAGTHWFWAGPTPTGVLVCGDFHNYYATLSEVASPCPQDLDGSGDVGFGDLLQVLSNWGNVGGVEDLDGSGTVDFGDVLAILSNWGPCP
jgi:hypothetical protein